MWQRFTERARRVVFFAQEEAGRLSENCVNTEHLLLGLVRENDSVAAKILERVGVSLGRIRSEVERQVTRGDGRLGQDMQLTPRAKRVVDLAYEEARNLNNNYIGTEHLLLGLIREREGLAGRILEKVGVQLDGVRKETVAMQDGPSGRSLGELDAGLDCAITARGIITGDQLQLRGKSLLSMADLSRAQIDGIMQVSDAMAGVHKRYMKLVFWPYPKSLAMIFEKPSLRTRTTFDLGMQQLGGLAVALGPAEIGLGTRESVPDAARNLERWVDCIVARVFKHEALEELKANCKIPIINGLSDREHPCQILADLFTIQQKKGKLEGIKLGYVGDGNNVLNSLLLGGAIAGMTVYAACPEGYKPDPAIQQIAIGLAADAARIQVFSDPAQAVKDADVVYTDVWASMGQESESEIRRQAFAGSQVNAELMAHAKPDAIFMHCLPAHRGEEVTDEVLDGPQSVVFDQAENRLHAQKAVLALLIGA